MRTALALSLLLLAYAPARAEDLVGKAAPALEIESWAAAAEGKTLADLHGSAVVLLLDGAVDLDDAQQVQRWNDLRAGWWEKGLRVVLVLDKAPAALPAELEFSVVVARASAYGTPAAPRAVLISPRGLVLWEGEPDDLGEDLVAKAVRKAKYLHCDLSPDLAKAPGATAYRKGRLVEAREIAGSPEKVAAEPWVAQRVAALLTYWQQQAKRAAMNASFDEAVTCLKRIVKHFADAPEATAAEAELKALKSNKLVAKEASAADAYARLRQELARTRGKQKKIAALAKKAARAATRKPKTRSVERAERLASKLAADPATAAVKAFIAKQKIKTKSSSWRNSLPKPPQVAFAKGKTYLWHLETNQGAITLKLYPDTAPMHVSNAIYLTLLGFYDGLTFHRVIPGFMAQGGCPDGSGSGRIGYLFDGEFNGGPGHDGPGKLSTANAGPGTDGSQFFITFSARRDLDSKHTVYGEVVSGDKALKRIEKLGSADGPTSKPVVIEKASISLR